jgi:ABC-type branched-subunit amino acid transport system permease subunit
VVTVLSEGFGLGLVSTSFIKMLGKTLCLCLIAIAMDLVWGYCGILSLGHFAFFGLGGYMIGMWLMYERTKDIVSIRCPGAELPATLGRDHATRSARRSSVWSAAPRFQWSGISPTVWRSVGACGAGAGAACAGVRLAGVPLSA